MANKRKIHMDLVDAQQARRVLDRLVGYQISPILWKKIMRGLSAGRVQSAATRIIVDRENEIKNFIPEEYWPISAFLKELKDDTVFEAKLTKINGEKAEISNGEDAAKIKADLEKGNYKTEKVTTSKRKRKPAAPFTTSTLQQDANRKLGYSSEKNEVMLVQQLYEGLEIKGRGHIGLVTYIRTDSVRISDVAKAQAKTYITENFGEKYSFKQYIWEKGKYSGRARSDSSQQT